ncbi:tripartite tricarboxylate transporter substrate binding protein [Variovorax sp. PDNC026]|uniref:Bug family tripartite tricarboxylate transporter substrate binding protein n=1 Tax=Variovorax sp. PDNC026 TaxID=2811425 RepID=UPI0019665D90|nr:tripartite tricarboxylate transporter substrate binding protein [Variovorax sp. PDNC026]QRY31843.1 tripartite tricarboxylate transporter substrate binding protein [Variovorax sp. PDNC026]
MIEPVRISRRRLLAGAAATLGAAAVLPVRAQAAAYPSHAVRFIVPVPPGGGADLTARILAKKIGELAGQPVVVENKPGGNGFIAVQTVLSAPPDGYTLLLGSNSTLSTNAATFKSLPYDPIADFAPISLISRGPCFIVVAPNSPFKTLADLIAAAKKKPGALNYATGTMSYTLYTEWLNAMAGIRTTPINYKGSGEILSVVMAGTVDYAMVDESGSHGLVRSGRLRALAYTDAKRSRTVPDVPSVAELGFPDLLAMNWVAAAAPARTPKPVMDRLATLFAQAGDSQEVREFFEKQGGQRIMSTAAEMRRYQSEEIARWKKLVAATGLELQ